MKTIILSLLIAFSAMAAQAQTRVVVRHHPHLTVAVVRPALVAPVVVARPAAVVRPVVLAHSVVVTRPVIVARPVRRVVVVH